MYTDHHKMIQLLIFLVPALNIDEGLVLEMLTSESHHVGKLILQGCCIYQVSQLVNSLLVCLHSLLFKYL